MSIAGCVLLDNAVSTAEVIYNLMDCKGADLLQPAESQTATDPNTSDTRYRSGKLIWDAWRDSLQTD
jgi:hypothetical protein